MKFLLVLALLSTALASNVDNERKDTRVVTFTRYMTLDEINEYMEEVSMSNVYASLQAVGTTSLGRPIQALKFSNGGLKNGVWIDCGMHGQEWISPPMCLAAIVEIITNPTYFLDMADFYILPVTNPDGYDFTWTANRLWRKTRGRTSNPLCLGTDANKNFNISWTMDSNTDPCSEKYHGDTVMSEPEVAAITSYMAGILNLKLYMTMHSYGQSILFPWSSTYELAPSYTLLNEGAQEAVEAIRINSGDQYSFGSSSNTYGPNYGESMDYAYMSGVPFAYTFYLPPRTGGGSPFELPESEIQSSVYNAWFGVRRLIEFVLQRVSPPTTPSPTTSEAPTTSPEPTMSETSTLSPLPTKVSSTVFEEENI